MNDEALLMPIALTCGEPASVAPEITAKAWLALRGKANSSFFLIGDADYHAARAAAAGVPIDVVKITKAGDAAKYFQKSLPVLHRPLPAHPRAGVIDSRTAHAVISAIDEAVALAGRGEVSALVTNPIQKEALYAAGFKHQGHTDYLASLAGGGRHEVMMLVAADLRAIPITIHIPLKDVALLLTEDMIVSQAHVVVQELKKYFSIANPRLAFTGLNPHAGENGAMGHEEQTVIIPALDRLRSAGITVLGPLAADTAFHAEVRASYDAILCMYHDQALIPVKTLDFHGGVNVTLGLPFIRTSPDHGTALDLAGTGKAQAESLVAAIRLANEMASNAL